MRVLLFTLNIITMKANDTFYYIEELKTYVKLASISSFKLEKPYKSSPDEFYKCYIISGKSVYICSRIHFDNLTNILTK